MVDDLLGDFQIGLGVVLHQHFHGEPSQMVGKVLHVLRQVVDGIGTDVFQVTQDLTRLLELFVDSFRKLPRQVDTTKVDSAGASGLGRNVRGGTWPIDPGTSQGMT